jgi:hypothetical protein
MGLTVSPGPKEERPADEEGLPTGKRMAGGGAGTLHCKRSAVSQQPGSSQRHRPSYDPPRSASKRFHRSCSHPRICASTDENDAGCGDTGREEGETPRVFAGVDADAEALKP